MDGQRGSGCCSWTLVLRPLLSLTCVPKKQAAIHSVNLKCDSSLRILNTFVDSVDAARLRTVLSRDFLGGVSKGLVLDNKSFFTEWCWLHYSYFMGKNYA